MRICDSNLLVLLDAESDQWQLIILNRVSATVTRTLQIARPFLDSLANVTLLGCNIFENRLRVATHSTDSVMLQ